MSIQILLIISSVVWLGCVLVNLSIQPHYTVRKDDFLWKMFLRCLKMDYTSISEQMSPKDRRLYLLTFVGIFVFVFPPAYFLSSVFHRYLQAKYIEMVGFFYCLLRWY